MFEDLANLKLKKLDKYLFLEDPENWKKKLDRFLCEPALAS